MNRDFKIPQSGDVVLYQGERWTVAGTSSKAGGRVLIYAPHWRKSLWVDPEDVYVVQPFEFVLKNFVRTK